MSEPRLAAADFARFFRAVHQTDPFPWQQRLLEDLVDHGEWPDVLDLPTGSGKTAALDIATFHLAVEAQRGTARRAALRVAFVVDRRLIVDDAFKRAVKLRDALLDPDDDVVRQVAAALQTLAGEGEAPLIVRSLRGGVPREDDWARAPVQPVLLCSTVDQVGSRLLFRGYGVSDRMKPVHAGLLGSDCLILLDEAHLSEPFRQTLLALKQLRQPDAAPWQVALLTATPGEAAERPFGLRESDRQDAKLAPRLKASKPARLVDVTNQSGVSPEDRRVDAIVGEAKAALAELTAGRAPVSPALGVVVNRVARARTVFDRMRSEFGEDAEITLIIGPTREVDRRIRERELDPIRTRGRDDPRNISRPFVIVATQTIEVGVDIDLDGLVTEAAALDALRQRFGRVNRAGRSINAVASIVAHRSDVAATADDPVYGDRIAKTWQVLQERAALSPDGLVDFGIDAMAGWLTQEHARDLATAPENAPVLLPAYADLWSQTSPIPSADPEVALFLHGPDRSPASVQIVWRVDIAARDAENATARESVAALLGLVPPRAAEAIEVPLWAARAWLREAHQAAGALSDTAERTPTEERSVADGTSPRDRRAFRYRGPDDPESRWVQTSELRDGDLIVVPSMYGGCDSWGWNPAEPAPTRDVAELAAWDTRSRRFAVRLTPELIRQEASLAASAGSGDGVPDWERFAAILPDFLAAHAEDSATDLLGAIAKRDYPKTLRDCLEELSRAGGRLDRPWFAYGLDAEDRPRGVVFRAPFGIPRALDLSEAAAVPATESDKLGSLPGYSQSLDDHSRQVRDQARAFADRAALAEPVAADVALAAYLHDVGKLDPRFQAYLAGGDPFGWDGKSVLAKSARAALPANAHARAGLPPRWRHEALSVRLAQSHLDFASANDQALVLWLVGVHHGYGRPLFPHADPLDEAERDDLPSALGAAWRLGKGTGPQSLAFDFEGRDWAQIFVLLRQRYGRWGLARLEAIVRLADHRASEAARRTDAEGLP